MISKLQTDFLMIGYCIEGDEEYLTLFEYFNSSYNYMKNKDVLGFQKTNDGFWEILKNS